MATYFAQDGSYGDARGLIIVDTNSWSQDDWNAIEEVSDIHRASIAPTIALDNGDL